MLETIKATTCVDSEKCTKHGRNVYGNVEMFYRKGNITDGKLGNGKTKAGKRKSTINSQHLSFL
jgi:hypothetical protein